jgi:tetratricopeptide (TPR) repeat protein
VTVAALLALYVIWGRGDVNAYFERALNAGTNGDCDKAIAEYTEIIRRFPEQAAEAYYLRANVLADFKDDRKRAIADYTRALELKPKKKGDSIALLALWARAVAYEKTGQRDFAVADYTETLAAIDPAGPPHVTRQMVLLRRGELYRFQGKHEPALADFSEAIALDPADHRLYEARAKVHRGTGAEAEAVADEIKAGELKKS